MLTTIDESGRLNNYAAEPEMYFANYPSPEQQASYKLQGALASLFVVALVLVSVAVS
jgi:hypothetical protein